MTKQQGTAADTDPAGGPEQSGGCGPARQEPAGLEPAGLEHLDRWLAAAAADRDEGAFEQLVRRHTPALYAGALRATGSPQTAQDVVQEAWLSAWLHLPGFRGQSQVRTWLVRIATTKALNALRRPERTVPIEHVPEPPTSSTEHQAEQRERATAVRAAVAALPERQREAVVLRDLEGLSYEQVAAALGCSVGSVKSALFRGRQALALSLSPYRDGHDAAGAAAGARTPIAPETGHGPGQGAAPNPVREHP